MRIEPHCQSRRFMRRLGRQSSLFLFCLSAILLTVGCGSTAKPAAQGPARTYSFWPLFPDEPRVQFLKSFDNIDDVSPRESSALENIIYGSEEQTDVLLVQKPYGVEMSNGKIYVCDIRGPAVVILDLNKNEARMMGVSGTNRVQQPVDITIADDGMIYVADLQRGVIFVYDQNERSVAMFGFAGFEPVAIADHGDELFVVDRASQQVVVMNRLNGDVVRRIGGPGAEDGQFIRPIGIDVDEDGTVYVSDTISCRIQKFTNDGQFISSFGTISDQIGAFVRPKQLAVDSNKNIYVVDSGFQNVQIFNPDDQLLMFFGAAGTHPGSMALPVGISVYEGDLSVFADYIHPAFNAEKLIIVTNQFGDNKVSVYALGELKEGFTARDVVNSSVATAGTTERPGQQAGQLQGEPVAPEGDQNQPAEDDSRGDENGESGG